MPVYGGRETLWLGMGDRKVTLSAKELMPAVLKDYSEKLRLTYGLWEETG